MLIDAQAYRHIDQLDLTHLSSPLESLTSFIISPPYTYTRKWNMTPMPILPAIKPLTPPSSPHLHPSQPPPSPYPRTWPMLPATKPLTPPPPTLPSTTTHITFPPRPVHTHGYGIWPKCQFSLLQNPSHHHLALISTPTPPVHTHGYGIWPKRKSSLLQN